MKLKYMYSPLKMGSVELKNRFAVPPMGNNFAETNGCLSDRSLAYYEERAKGGYGFIIVEATVVEKTAKGGFRKPCLFDDSTIASFKRVTDACHRHGAKMCVELQHAGPEGNAKAAGHPIKSASRLPSRSDADMPMALTTREIYDLVEKFGDAAYRAKQAGFDAVEIHCAHGYLLNSFISARTNKRQDEFGGSMRNRMRFPELVIRRIRERVGDDMAILARINVRDDMVGGMDEHDAAILARWLEGAGIDCIDVSRAVHLKDEYMWAPTAIHAGFNAEYITEIKRAVGIPVIAVGRFSDPYYAELMVSQCRADIVAFGRQSLAEPHLPRMYAEDDTACLIPCIACLQGCVPNMYKGQPLECLANPLLGHEGEMLPAEKKKKILVVGAGPGGLAFAWLAAMRGHSVTVWEEKSFVGGQLYAGSVPPGKGEINGLICAYKNRCEANGVEIVLEKKADEQAIAEFNADAVVIATGALPLHLPIEGLSESGFVDAVDFLEGKVKCGQNLLLVGGGYVGCETADFLSELGHKVTIVELRDEVGVDMIKEHKIICMKSFEENHVRCITGAKVSRFYRDGVSYADKAGQQHELRGFDTLVLSMGRVSHSPLANLSAPEVIMLGDVLSPRSALDATREAYAAAVKI